MEKLLEAASIAWNPVGQVRERARSGSLTFGSVLVPFIGIVIGCNLTAVAAQNFFAETLLNAIGGNMPDLPIAKNDFAQKMLSALGVLVPIGLVSLLPATVFEPAGRSAATAAMLVVAAAWAFYGAAIVAPVYFILGALATANPNLALQAYVLLAIPIALAIVVLTVFFWFRTLCSALGLSGGRVIGISVVTLISIVGLVVVISYLVLAGTEA